MEKTQRHSHHQRLASAYSRGLPLPGETLRVISLSVSHTLEVWSTLDASQDPPGGGNRERRSWGRGSRSGSRSASGTPGQEGGRGGAHPVSPGPRASEHKASVGSKVSAGARPGGLGSSGVRRSLPWGLILPWPACHAPATRLQGTCTSSAVLRHRCGPALVERTPAGYWGAGTQSRVSRSSDGGLPFFLFGRPCWPPGDHPS